MGQDFQTEINMRVEAAIDKADRTIFVVSGKNGLTYDDEYVARLLYRTKKPVILAINKADDFVQNDAIHEFCSLGLGDPLTVFGTYGIGIDDVLDAAIHVLPGKKKGEYGGMMKFCVTGRPGVGKSSLVSAILNQERAIVSDTKGTTRDAIDTPFKRGGEECVVIDAAGVRKRSKVYENIEKYFVLRTMNVIE